MEWTVAVFGELRFPRGGVEAWKALVVDASRHEDWVEEFDDGGLDPAPVREVLDEIAAFPAPPEGPGRVKISLGSKEIHAVGFLADDGYRAWCAHLATLFRVAADAGATGDLTFVNVAGLYGYRVEVKPGSSSFTAIRDRAGVDRLRAQDAFATAVGMLGGKPVQTSQEQAPSGKDEGPYQQIVALLEALPAAKIEAALKARGGVRDPATQKDLLRAADALALLRRGPSEGHRAFAANLARELDPKGFEPIAVALVALVPRSADLALTAAAVWALKGAKHPGATDALLQALADPRRDPSSMPAYHAFDALQARLGEALPDALLPRLTPAFAASADAAVCARVVQLLRQRGIAIPAASLTVLEARKEPILRNTLSMPIAPAPAAKAPAKKAASKKTPAKKTPAPKAKARAR